MSPDNYPSATKVQVIDTGRFDNLQWEIDNPETGHVSIFVDDPALMEQWAATRGTGEIHPLTEEVLNSRVNSFRNP